MVPAHDAKRDVLQCAKAVQDLNIPIAAVHLIRSASFEYLRLYYLAFSVSEEQRPVAYEAVLVVAPDRPAFVLGPGAELTRLAVSLGKAGHLPDLRRPEHRQVWAAMTVLCNPLPRLPLPGLEPLPLAPGMALPPTGYRDEGWRSWETSRGPEGTQVMLPWIEGDRLCHGRVLVPDDGVGARVLPGEETIARGVSWSIPAWAVAGNGKMLPVRILRSIGRPPYSPPSDDADRT